MEKVGRQTLFGLAVLFIANKGDFPLSFLKQQLTLWLNRTRREKDESKTNRLVGAQLFCFVATADRMPAECGESFGDSAGCSTAAK